MILTIAIQLRVSFHVGRSPTRFLIIVGYMCSRVDKHKKLWTLIVRFLWARWSIFELTCANRHKDWRPVLGGGGGGGGLYIYQFNIGWNLQAQKGLWQWDCHDNLVVVERKGPYWNNVTSCSLHNNHVFEILICDVKLDLAKCDDLGNYIQ